MKRYLVVANQTVDSPQLQAAIEDRMAEGASVFHLVVPEDHGSGMTWSEGRVRRAAEDRLDHALRHYAGLGVAMSGEVASGPVEGVGNVLLREGEDRFAEVIVSTLPATVSRWLRLDAPSRIQRATAVPVTHVVAALVDA